MRGSQNDTAFPVPARASHEKLAVDGKTNLDDPAVWLNGELFPGDVRPHRFAPIVLYSSCVFDVLEGDLIDFGIQLLGIWSSEERRVGTECFSSCRSLW